MSVDHVRGGWAERITRFLFGREVGFALHSGEILKGAPSSSYVRLDAALDQEEQRLNMSERTRDKIVSW